MNIAISTTALSIYEKTFRLLKLLLIELLKFIPSDQPVFREVTIRLTFESLELITVSLFELADLFLLISSIFIA